MSNNTLLNHIISILVLPFSVTVLVPWALITFIPRHPLLQDATYTLYLAVLFITIGIIGLIWTISLFAIKGKGTIAPWNPTSYLILTGPYAYVRNPMIISIAFILMGQSFLTNSVYVGLWTILFVVINNIFFRLFEEPELERKFGSAYSDYADHVRRWLPKLKAYKRKHPSLAYYNDRHIRNIDVIL